MKAVTITLPEDLDERAATEARRLGISKSELIRRGLRSVLPDSPGPPSDDPWQSLAGFGSPDRSALPGEIDDIVYGT
jgi:hypothetical protein